MLALHFKRTPCEYYIADWFPHLFGHLSLRLRGTLPPATHSALKARALAEVVFQLIQVLDFVVQLPVFQEPVSLQPEHRRRQTSANKHRCQYNDSGETGHHHRA